ncbi:hypothetical protein [Caulobacter sp. DWR2-3-1b2]|uniref:hypothetical protein n=1 Tax=unclassified Caulobacter TaxID=2648921 RepID=UPI003CE6D781
MHLGSPCLLPLREKVSASGRRMRGRKACPERSERPLTRPCGPPSPARGEG